MTRLRQRIARATGALRLAILHCGVLESLHLFMKRVASRGAGIASA